MLTDDEVLELAARRGRPRPGTWGRRGSPGVRYVRTPEGAEKYGLPVGSRITRDAVERAKRRGRAYNVPEDDNDFGSQPPTGRTKRPAANIVQSIRNAPAPKVVQPSGPKQIGIGQSGFGFPDGSRAFRSQKHQNFAIVRTPDYQLVGITDKGVAFELDGDLERELNEELDDDLSKDWLPDEPNPMLVDDPDDFPEEGDEAAPAKPARVEDMPGFLSEEMLQGILDGMKTSGIDQNSRDMAELHMRRNNDKIRGDFDAMDEPEEPEVDELGDVVEPEEVVETREVAPSPVPERQPDVGTEPDPKGAEPAETKPAKSAAPAKPSQPADKAAAERAAKAKPSTDDEDLAKLEELTRSRPAGVAEGKVNGKRATLRRNRVDDSIEYDDDSGSTKDRDEFLKRSRDNAEPRDTSDVEPADMTDQEIDDVLADIDAGLRAGLISRKDARQRRQALADEKASRGADAPDEPSEPEQDDTVGDTATKDWADTAEPGSAASNSDGLVAVRDEDGKWDTPLGKVESAFLDESDVEDDDEPVIVRNGPGKPVGATKQISSVEDLDDVSTTDGVAIIVDGEQFNAVRNSDGTFDIELPDGLKIKGQTADDIASVIEQGGEVWHVPNQDLTGAPTKKSWKVGDVLRNIDDLIAQKIGTRLRYKFNRPINTKIESEYEVIPEGFVLNVNDGVELPAHTMKKAVAAGRVSVKSLPSDDEDVDPKPAKLVTDPSKYVPGDKISDYRHLRNMKPGQQVTLMIPASKNGGKPTAVLLTRTDDSANLGGFMFLVGKAGRGYNSFGENNASIFQAIYEGNLHFGDVTNGIDSADGDTMSGQWDTTKNISLWDGGPQVSEFDIRTFIDAQVHARAMQGSYYNTSLLPKNSPFRSKSLRDTLSEKAIAAYSRPGNPARHKPALIRFAAEKIGLQFTDPGSALIPDDLELSDFNEKVTIGRWLRGTGAPAESNMGPEQISVSKADIKTAMAVLDNMLDPKSNEDPDKILKRVFAMRGSPLQDMNVAVSIAAYFGMKRYKNGSNRPVTTIARQHDKTRNKELLRQMLREQLEGRPPGYYGIPQSETWTNANGDTFENRTDMSLPAINSLNDPDPNASLRGDRDRDDTSTQDAGAPEEVEAVETQDIVQEDEGQSQPEPEPEPEPVPQNINALRQDNPGILYLEDANGNVVQPQTKRRVDFDRDRPLTFDHATKWDDREDVYELDSSEAQLWVDLANQRAVNRRTPYTTLDTNGKRLFVTENGSGVAMLDGDTIRAIEIEDDNDLMNLMPTLVRYGARTAILRDHGRINNKLSTVGLRATSFSTNMNTGRTDDIAFTLDPDYIGAPAVAPDPGMPTLPEPGALQGARQAFADYEKRDFHLAVDKGNAGDGWHAGAAKSGKKLWGQYGASGLLMRHVDPTSGEERFMLVQRAGKNKKSALYGKWQLPGGGLDAKETDAQGAARETIEEINPPVGVLASLKAVGENRFDDPSGWHYTNLTADIPEQFTPTRLDKREILDTKWLTRAEIAQMESKGELHPALASSIRQTLATYGGSPATALPTLAPQNPVSIFQPAHGSINDKGAKRIPGTALGSNGGQQWDIPMPGGGTERYFVKPTKSEAQSKQEALASDLYRLAGARAPEVDYSAADKSLYSKMMDVRSQGGSDFRDRAREDFAADAWLANWDVRLGDNIMFDGNGNAVRLDNGGSMEYSATGRKKPFGNSVNEVDTLRQSGNIGARTFGARAPGKYDPWERTSAQKVVNVPDQAIKDLVHKHGLPDSLAKTLIARRDDIASRYGLTPAAPAPAQAAPTPDVTPEVTPSAPSAPESAPPAAPAGPAPSVQRIDTLPSRIPGMIPAVGDHARMSLSDGTTRDVAVTKPKNADQGVVQQVTSKLYQELGIGTVNAEWDDSSGEVFTDLVAQGPDAGSAGQAKFREGFVADAWLGNRAVGQSGKYIYDTQGNPVRVDNRGSLDMRLNGTKKNDFGKTVGELDSLRNPGVNPGAAALYGARTNGKADDFEWEGAQKIIDLPDSRIREIVKDGGGSDSLADTLIARKQDIQSRYGLMPTGASIPTMRPDTVDAEPSLADARRNIGGAKMRYVRAKVGAQGYNAALKKAGSLDQAFDDLWRQSNPDKPDRISGGKITDTLDIHTASDDDIIDLALQFDLDPTLIATKAKEIGPGSDRDGRALHEAIAEQRGYEDTNAPVSPDQLDKMASASGQYRHVYRTVNPHSGMSGPKAADEYKKDQYWRRGTGAKAHGEGIYVAQNLNNSLGYDNGMHQSGVIEMVFDKGSSRIEASSLFSGYGGKMQAVRNRIQARTDLTQAQKDVLNRAFLDQGTAATILGYDALWGNASYGVQGPKDQTSDFNILNKGKITFSDQDALLYSDLKRRLPRQPMPADYRAAQRAIQGKLTQSNAAQGNTVTAGAAPTPQTNANGISVGQTIRPNQLPLLGIGSEVSYTKQNGVTLLLRLTSRGWVNTATNRVQNWMTSFAPRSRAKFDVVIAN